MTQALGILSVYLFATIITGVVLGTLYLMGNLMFYLFCWGFVTLDNYLQERYWKSLEKNKTHSYKNAEYKKAA